MLRPIENTLLGSYTVIFWHRFVSVVEEFKGQAAGCANRSDGRAWRGGETLSGDGVSVAVRSLMG